MSTCFYNPRSSGQKGSKRIGVERGQQSLDENRVFTKEEEKFINKVARQSCMRQKWGKEHVRF